MRKEESELTSLQKEILLWKVVDDVNEQVRGDGCSIFLREEGTNKYVLRDSTKLNPYLGNYYFTVIPGEEPTENMGITKWAVVKRVAVLKQDIRKCKYWTHYNSELLDREEEYTAALKNMRIGHCELDHYETGSFLAVPLIKEDEVVGVIRTVRSRDGEPFNEQDKEEMKKLVEVYLPQISAAIDISYLLEIGSMLDLRELCNRFVHVIERMFKVRGCSIYLLAEEKDGIKIYRCSGTTGLHVIQPSGVPREIRDPYNEAYYEYKERDIPKHLTTAVIRYGRNIFTDDLTKFNPKEIFEEIDRKSPKYVETYWEDNKLIPAGPSIFIPLFSPRRGEKDEKPNVIGVIIINRPQGAEPFSPQQFRLCLSLSERFSKVILYSKFISLLNKPLVLGNHVKSKELFDRLIDQISEVLGAPAATLYLKYDDNELKSISSSGEILKGEEDVYKLPSKPTDYGHPPYIGYTVWVATFKKVLIFNTPEELNKFSPRPIHSDRKRCEVGLIPPPRFLGVPIEGTDGRLLGVLRTAKTMEHAPFTENDKILFSSLGAKLSPVIENLVVLEHLRKEKAYKIEQIFTRELIDKIEKICSTDKDSKTMSFVARRIKEFLTIEPTDERELGIRVLESICSLWEDSGILTTTQPKPLGSFKFFDEQILSELPGYRGHFIHQHQVFLLGYYFIEMLKKLGYPFYESYCQSLSLSIPKEEKEKIANIAWLVASTFHDIAYPLEEVKGWLPKMMSDFLGDAGKEIAPEVPIEKIFFQDKSYLNFINELAGFFTQKCFIPEIEEVEFRNLLQREVSLSKDHGVLGALILLRPYFLRKEEVVLPAALSIALHKRLGLKVKGMGGKISYDKNPLFFLLLYCDLIQEWSRDPEKNRKKPPTLKKIVVTKDISEIEERIKNVIPEEAKQNKDTIYIHAEIEVGDEGQQKIEECKDWRDFIHSSNPCFIIEINNNPIVYKKGGAKLCH